MARKTPTAGDTRKLVTSTARKIARDHGTTLGPAAVRRLLAPSVSFFKKNPPEKINVDRLEETLTPLVVDAVRQRTPPPKKVKVKRLRGAFYENPRPKPKPVTAKAIDTAMKRATCHFLWFC